MTGLMGQDNGKDGFDEMKDNRMDNIVECAYNMDNGYVEVWFTDGNMLRIKCCLLYTSPSPRDGATSRMTSSA